MEPVPQPADRAPVPAGWYGDPWLVAPLRWWDGREWTAHVSPPEGDAAPAAPSPSVREPNPAFTGDLVRRKTFTRVRKGYHRERVDFYMVHLAAELDAGRPVDAAIDQARFNLVLPGYDRKEVDDFLAESHLVRGRPTADPPAPAAGAGPKFPHQLGSDDRRGRVGGPPRTPAVSRKSKREACAAEWRRLDTIPGFRMKMRRDDRGWSLVSSEGAVLADIQDRRWFDERPLVPHDPLRWRKRLPITVRVDHRDYVVQMVRGPKRRPGRRRAPTSDPSAARAPSRTDLAMEHIAVLDSTGRPVLQLIGIHFDRQARSTVRRSSGGLIHFPVSGTSITNAVLSATNDSGTVLLRCRETEAGHWAMLDPSVPVTAEYLLITVLALKLLPSYFRRPGGGA
jgi:DivIVA domain-containing protein